MDLGRDQPLARQPQLLRALETAQVRELAAQCAERPDRTRASSNANPAPSSGQRSNSPATKS